MDGGMKRESTPPSGASNASSATYSGVSLVEQTAAQLLTFIEIYVALQPTELTFVEIYVAPQSIFLTSFKIYVAPVLPGEDLAGVIRMRSPAGW